MRQRAIQRRTLRIAGEAYLEAFRTAPADYYPGINALTLSRLWEHVTGHQSRLDLAMISGGVGWATDCALARNKDFWALATRAELALVENNADAAIEDYGEAAALAVTNRDRFAIDSSSQQLDFLGELGFRREIASKAALIIDRAEKQLDALLGGATPTSRPTSSLFSGHMIDNPAVRGEGKAKPARFPATKIDAAAARIRAALDEIGAGAGDLGLCGGACGGDLLFAEACLERGMRLELRLARRENEFLAESVTFADPDRRWERSFRAVTQNPATMVLVVPDELGPAPDGVSVHDRCNRLILYSALSYGLQRASFVTLWNGEPGDGPGGTEHMVELVRKLTGRQADHHRSGNALSITYECLCRLAASIGALRATFPEVQRARCPFRKSYPDVLMVQSGQERNGGDAAGPLDSSTLRRIFLQS